MTRPLPGKGANSELKTLSISRPSRMIAYVPNVFSYVPWLLHTYTFPTTLNAWEMYLWYPTKQNEHLFVVITGWVLQKLMNARIAAKETGHCVAGRKSKTFIHLGLGDRETGYLPPIHFSPLQLSRHIDRFWVVSKHWWSLLVQARVAIIFWRTKCLILASSWMVCQRFPVCPS